MKKISTVFAVGIVMAALAGCVPGETVVTISADDVVCDFGDSDLDQLTRRGGDWAVEQGLAPKGTLPIVHFVIMNFGRRKLENGK
jgi:hypothetical protein